MPHERINEASYRRKGYDHKDKPASRQKDADASNHYEGGSGKVTSSNDGSSRVVPNFQDADSFLGAAVDGNLSGAGSGVSRNKGDKSPHRPTLEKGERAPGTPIPPHKLKRR